MSEIRGELARTRDSFERPTLRLLDSKWAPLVVAIFRSTFSRDRRAVASERLHAQVDAYLDDLRTVGETLPPNATGRSLCMQWTRDQWLYRADGNDGPEYSLTSHALEALDLVQSMSRERALLSESRLNTILDAVRRWALEASPDADARIERLNDQIRELEAERDRLAAGGTVEVATNDRMLDGYVNLTDLIGQLPSDFKRVEESVAQMHREILRDFREEDRRVSEVLDDYLVRQEELIRSTPEGRAFDGAFVLLRDEALMLEFTRNVQAILRHPFAAYLEPGDVTEFRGAVGLIRQGTKDVLSQRHRLTATLREHIVNHDVLAERELDRTLRGIERELATWMETAGPRATVDVEIIPYSVEVGHMRERFYDPASAAPPPPLENVADEAPEALTLEQIRQQGGPSLSDLRTALADAFATGDTESVGQMFNELPDELRRPVEILGLLHVVSRLDALEGAEDTEVFKAIRPSGEHREFLVPRMSLDPKDLAALHEQTEEAQ